jgi:hypothetical protein
MRQKTTQALYDYWQTLCRGKIVPDRNELDPSKLAPLLQDVFILGADHAGSWRYRVAGTRLTAFAGRELRDEPFDRWWRSMDRLDANRLISGVANDSIPLVGGITGQGADQRHYDFEVLLLPLRHGGRNKVRMLGGLFPCAETARKLSLQIEDFGILSIRTLFPTGHQTQQFGTVPDNIDAIIDRRRALRVIEGGLQP